MSVSGGYCNIRNVEDAFRVETLRFQYFGVNIAP